jgi:hypothetical protein
MKITNKQLKQIIKEELEGLVNEDDLLGGPTAAPDAPDPNNPLAGPTAAPDAPDPNDPLAGPTTVPDKKPTAGAKPIETRVANIEKILKQLIAKIK